MKITEMNKTSNVVKQYITDEKLNIRKSLHQKYSTNQQGFGNWLYSMYEFKNGYKVLELGSGNGDMWESHIDELSKKIELTLSDFSQGMVDILSIKYIVKGITTRKIDIQSIPFEDNTFDIVIANMMLYHVPDLNKGIKEVHRVLKSNGKFYAATFGENGLSEYLNNTLYSLDMISEQKIEYTFTLQNGKKILSRVFKEVECKEYKDKLEITNTEDLIKYIKTMGVMAGLSNIDEEKLTEYFNSIKEKMGKICINKEYGTFIAIK